jgi:hypothetical protein
MILSTNPVGEDNWTFLHSVYSLLVKTGAREIGSLPEQVEAGK